LCPFNWPLILLFSSHSACSPVHQHFGCLQEDMAHLAHSDCLPLWPHHLGIGIKGIVLVGKVQIFTQMFWRHILN
jgi:hypothetical protein